MRYVVVDEKRGDVFTSEHSRLEDAIKHARYHGGYVLESINPDEDAIDHMDGNVVWTADTV